MALILAMFTLHTIHIASNWYITWLAFIKYGGTTDDAWSVLVNGGPSAVTTVALDGLNDLLTVLRMAIADSIMASLPFPFLPVLNFSHL